MSPTCRDMSATTQRVAPILARWVRVADTKFKMSWQFVSARADILSNFRNSYVEIYYMVLEYIRTDYFAPLNAHFCQKITTTLLNTTANTTVHHVQQHHPPMPPTKLGCAFRRNSGGFRRNSDPRHQLVPFRPGTGTGMCYNTNLDIPVYSGWYLSTRFLQVENARTYSK